MLTLQLLRSLRRRPQLLPLSPAANPSIATAPAATMTTLHPTKHPRQHPLPFFLSNITQQSTVWWHQRLKHCAATPSPSPSILHHDAGRRQQPLPQPSAAENERQHQPRQMGCSCRPTAAITPASRSKKSIISDYCGGDGGGRGWDATVVLK